MYMRGPDAGCSAGVAGPGGARPGGRSLGLNTRRSKIKRTYYIIRICQLFKT